MSNEPTIAYDTTTTRNRSARICSNKEFDDIFDDLSNEQIQTMPCQFTEEELD